VSAAPRIWLFGATSMVGWSVYQADPTAIRPFCNRHVKHPKCADWTRIQIDSLPHLEALFATGKPDILIHCGGVCGVRKCEESMDWAWRVNVLSMAAILVALPTSVRLVYVSSDHVFGHAESPCLEQTTPTPISHYGRTRVAAEELLREARPDGLILRVPLGVGPSIDGRTGHLDWLQYRHGRGLPITVIKDEVRAVVSAPALGRRILDYAHSSITGTRHITGPTMDRVELAQKLCEAIPLSAEIKVESRHAQCYPHLGTVRLETSFTDALAEPLPLPELLTGSAGFNRPHHAQRQDSMTW